jgi:hypothetical protein
MGGQMAGARGNTDIQIEGIKTGFAECVQNACGKDAAHPAAFHNNR